ncbi:ABC transporter permease [Ferruginivarius sediminum]|uniref:ABC transporter permease n=1 Tax=Ferruginivarius sediminum TaxID=2661937 RepID=A0A369TDG3_9PROT|nr:ABC transporter permease [Ferruginivarius sediminum]RDD62197.1 ABC transporter permease [Ferruginivarius sediminum]
MPDSAVARSHRSLLSRINLEIREHAPVPQQVALLAAGLLLGLLVSALILVSVGVSVSALLNEFVISIVTSSRSMGNVLDRAAPLVIVGLSAAIAFKTRFWNIGIEGQVIFGAIGATLVANADIGPPELRLFTMGAAAMLAGMIWIALPLYLRLRLRINEIISTLLMNYIALNFLLHLLYGPWKDPVTAFPNSKIYEHVERLGSTGWLNISTSVAIAMVFVVIVAWIFAASRFGFLMKFVYANPAMARAIGVNVAVLTILAVLASGALSGLAGFAISAGIDNRMTQSFFVGYGFSGILIGFLARNNPIAVVFFAFLISALMVAGQSLQIFYQIPFSIVQLIQATIVICVAASEFLIRHRIRFVR